MRSQDENSNYGQSILGGLIKQRKEKGWKETVNTNVIQKYSRKKIEIVKDRTSLLHVWLGFSNSFSTPKGKSL